MTYAIKDAAVAVATDVYYLPMDTCPRGVKVLLLGGGGSAAVGQWDGKDQWYRGWFPLPKQRKEEK